MNASGIRNVAVAIGFVTAGLFLSTAASAQSGATLDKVLSTKTLRCGVQLDFPPSGFRNAKNEPDGFDVAYCKDIAAALGVTPQIVETPSSERIPSLVSNRIDVLVASTSITPQRALTVSFTRPYNAYADVVLTRKDTNIKAFSDLKGRSLGGVTGTTTEQGLRAAVEKWHDSNAKFTSYRSEAEAFMALNQGKVDAILQSDGVANVMIKSGQFPKFAVAGNAPTPPDIQGLAVRKSDTDFLRWLDVFIWNEIRTGRYAELHGAFFGTTKTPNLDVQ